MTNIPASVMPANEVIFTYHDLWHVEQSFRMSKSDLAGHLAAVLSQRFGWE